MMTSIFEMFDKLMNVGIIVDQPPVQVVPAQQQIVTPPINQPPVDAMGNVIAQPPVPPAQPAAPIVQPTLDAMGNPIQAQPAAPIAQPVNTNTGVSIINTSKMPAPFLPNQNQNPQPSI